MDPEPGVATWPRLSTERSTVSTSAAEFNAQIIEEFRANRGRVGGIFEGTLLLLLHHTGATSGRHRINLTGFNIRIWVGQRLAGARG
jgi:hypothetical protein